MLTHTAMWAGIPMWVLHLKAQNYAITLAFFLLEDRTLREEIHNSVLFHSIANAFAAPSAALTSLHGNVVEFTNHKTGVCTPDPLNVLFVSQC